MGIKILFKDDQLMVIDKPAGVTVNRADTVGEETVQDWVDKKFGYQFSVISYQSQVSQFSVNQSKTGKPKTDKPVTENRKQITDNRSNLDFYSRSGIVHRLDKETSGCLIIAKTPEAFIELQRQFKNREVKKEYLALVHGRVEPKEGTIRVPLARSRFDRQKFSVSATGRPAETSYEVIFYHSLLHTPYSLLRLFPITGRTHQIRVHLKYFGHPIVSDEKYGGKRAVADRKWCPRLFLHAAKITFTHPLAKNIITIESPLPSELKPATDKL